MSDLLEILDHVDPALLDYQEWVNVGMALKDEGYSCRDWDEWSKKDAPPDPSLLDDDGDLPF